jgi:plasmid stability protein
MKRTLVQFDEETHLRLRQRAFRLRRSVSSLVRELVAQGLDGGTARGKPKHVSQFASVRAGRSKGRPDAAVSEKHDDALAAAFKK